MRSEDMGDSKQSIYILMCCDLVIKSFRKVGDLLPYSSSQLCRTVSATYTKYLIFIKWEYLEGKRVLKKTQEQRQVLFL